MVLIQGLGKFRVLTLPQIRKYYFNGLARPLVQRRLGKLRAQNLLRAYPYGEQGALAWTLTSEAARLIERPERVFRRPPNRNTLAHDLAIAGIGLELERLGILYEWLGTYELELGLYHKERHIPDAIFRLKIGDTILGPIALEVENSLKCRDKIRSLLFEYSEWFKVTDLWLYWRKDWMLRAFRDVAKRFPEPRLWFAKHSLDCGNLLLLEDVEGVLLDLESYSQRSNEEPQNKASQSDTPTDTHDIMALEPTSVIREIEKSNRFRRLSSPDTLASAFPDLTDHSLSTINLGEAVVSKGIWTKGCRVRNKEGEEEEFKKELKLEGGLGNE
jgi:hypothetical protein